MMPRGQRRRSWRSTWLLPAVVVLGVVLIPEPSSAADGVALVTTIDGSPLAKATEAKPIRLHPERPADVALAVTNNSDSPIVVRTVRLQGTAISLTFFAYETTIALEVPPGVTDNLRFPLDLGDLRGQATGLFVGSVLLLDADRERLASERTVYDVRGSLWSVYGVFGLAIVGLTVLGFASALVALARHKLPENRFLRALRFLPPGIGMGLTLVFTLSAIRLFVPQPGRWVPLVVFSALGVFALGYITPSPEGGEEEDDFEPLGFGEQAARNP